MTRFVIAAHKAVSSQDLTLLKMHLEANLSHIVNWKKTQLHTSQNAKIILMKKMRGCSMLNPACAIWTMVRKRYVNQPTTFWKLRTIIHHQLSTNSNTDLKKLVLNVTRDLRQLVDTGQADSVPIILFMMRTVRKNA
jgi:hypothetical protein